MTRASVQASYSKKRSMATKCSRISAARARAPACSVSSRASASSACLDSPRNRRLHPPHHLARQAAKSQDVRVAHIAETPAPMARHGMTDEVEQTHQGEEGLACHLARAEGAV